LVTPSLSNSINDTNIFNCNNRLRGSNKEIEELRLWGIPKEIGRESIVMKIISLNVWDLGGDV